MSLNRPVGFLLDSKMGMEVEIEKWIEIGGAADGYVCFCIEEWMGFETER